MSWERPYQVLGLAPGADRAAIESAYRRLIKQHHPDRAGGDPETTKAVIHAYRQLTRRSVQLPVEVKTPPPEPRARTRHWRAAPSAIAAGLFLWLLPWPHSEKGRSGSQAALSDPSGAAKPEPVLTAAAMARVTPDGAAVEAGVEEARRLLRQSPAHALGYSRSCAADLDRLPGDALLDHCLAFDMAAAIGWEQDARWSPQRMAASQTAAAQAVLEDEVLAAARIRAVRLQVERMLVERR